MCGICGIMAEHGEIGIGKLLTYMGHHQQVRAQDSAGVAVFQMKPRETMLLQTIETFENGGYTFHNDEVNAEDLSSKLKKIEESPNLHFISSGQYMQIIKDLGLAMQLNERYGIDKLVGTHGVGHIRMSTRSDVTPLNAHPFATASYPDIAIVHNGEISNYRSLRLKLERKGHTLYSKCDSELIAVFLADELLRHVDFERANYSFIEKADGPFTYITATKDAIAVVRDKNGLRKAVVGYSKETDNKPGFVAIATDISAINAIGADYNVDTPAQRKPHIFYKGDIGYRLVA